MMLVHLLVILFFAAVGAIPSGRFDVVYPSMETLRSGLKRIRFRALDQDIELRLESAGDVIADDFTVINGENGEVDHSVDIQNLKGKLYKDAKIGAALHIDEDGPLTINGIINPKLRIQPDTSKRPSRNGRIAHRVIEVIRDEQHLRHDYKSLPPGSTRTFNYSTPLADDKCVKIEYAFVTESGFTEKFKSNSVTMETYLANLMNIAETLLDSLDLGIKVAIIGIIKLTKENEAKLAPYIPPDSTSVNPYDTVAKMSNFYKISNNELIRKADVVMHITTRPLFVISNGTVVERYAGMTGNTRGICYMCCKYMIVTDNHTESERPGTVAHETGHILGCHHDGDGNDCRYSDGYIMGDRNEKNGRMFSSCCKERVEDFITGKRASMPTCIVETCHDKQKRK